MIDRILQVRIRPIGQESVTRALRGITSGARQQQRAQEQSARGLERTRIQAERNATREAQRGAVARQRASQNEARDAQRMASQTARAREQATRQAARAESAANRSAQQEANELFRMRMRLHAQEQRQLQRAQERRGRVAGVVGLGVTGAATGAVLSVITGTLSALTARLEAITSAVGGRAGVMDEGQRTARGQDFEIQLARSSGEFFQGVTPAERATQMAALANEINDVALAAGQSPTELLNVLDTMQTQFSQFQVGRRDLRAIADEAQRTGADMNELATFIGNLNQQLGDTAPTAERAFDIMAQAGLQGAITPESFAANFGGSLGQFQTQTGLHGEDALRQFAALANAIRPGASSDAEAATQLRGLMNSMGDEQTRSRIALETGGHAVGHGASRHVVGGSQFVTADGRIDYMQLIRDLSSVEGAGDTNAIFHNSRARLAVSSLTRAQRGETDAPSAEALAGVSAETAAARRAEDIRRVQGTSAFDARQAGVQTEVEGFRGLQPRVAGAMQQIDFNEAALELGRQGELGGLLALLPDSLLAPLASAAAGIDPHTREMMGSEQTRMGLTLATGGAGGLLSDAFRGVGTLGNIGDRAQGLAQERAAVRLEPGTHVEIGDGSIDRFVRGVVTAMPSPTAPGSTSPSSLRLPLERR